MKKRRKFQTCDCIKHSNLQLAEMGSNTRIDVPFEINFKTRKMMPPRCMIATCKADAKKRERPMTMVATYCPICGVKYAD